MRLSVKLGAEDWLFARQFAHVDGEKAHYSHKTRLLGRKKEHEPKAKSQVPYLTVDEDTMFINHLNQPGAWMKWEWGKTKSVRLYHLMHPWKASIFSLFNEVDHKKERRRSKRYFRAMRRCYKSFSHRYEENYENAYGLLLEGKNRNAQVWIPSDWLTKKHEWFLDKLEELSGLPITFGSTDEHWKKIRDSRNGF